MKKKLIFFDTETTGNTTEDSLCQLAYKTGDETFNELYKPHKKIPPEASAVHHITNKMIVNKPVFKESADYQKIKKLFENENSILVAHNAPFDIAMMRREGIEIENSICTLRLARHLDPDEKIDRYNLQYLRYLLEIEVDATAHDAMGDVLVLEELYNRLEKKMRDIEGGNAIKEMMEISSHPSLLRSFKFGKHNGLAIKEVARIDRGYLEWLLAQKQAGDEIDEDWIDTLKHHLDK